ncbi:hypothetical protein [Clostridium sp.]|uniref:hypothetical protein n=1 Tax=Clostridium sp. TaxID=1506 RepID=UPI0028FEFBC6|nr:hypothetical protein [Clostridium sp.]MDU7261461.1 hypothetical protein [Clostridium butyricum]MDU1069847.1 hypothetical protein [Clostridium sp.]MDU2679673.1 hypothetical protein [Clostridium sp.]MDU4213871.1 hypothetical protein [Clostridium sp.]MDU5176919.1 hypothetical protein [Clostridium sp.]
MNTYEIGMENIPPEKYYEACITHHLVNEFKDRFNIRLYPFSISQVEEYKEGYDFGYKFSNDSFVIQYKRPIANSDEKYYWKINRLQLDNLNANNKFKSYYALPAFSDTSEWYKGFEKSFFVESAKLQNYLKNKNNKNNNINSECNILEDGENFIDRYSSKQKNILYSMKEEVVTMEDVIHLANDIEKEMKNNIWVYLMEV